MDAVDRSILRELQRNARMTNAELAQRVGLTASPCLRRVRQLEKDGLIRGYRAVLDHDALELGFRTYVTIVMHREDRVTVERFEREVADLSAVIAAYRLFGDPDYLLLVAVQDVAGYERLYREVLCNLPGVGRVTSHLVMKEVKPDQGAPLGGERHP
ncbi:MULTISPECIES: Lrp/AsnC family transcriptional regulator [Streptomyces]|uniref:Lrp/AsnC family transcriptional regulator n=1 Tax=Streptomyces TaxID=1883 RepID=UPI002248CA76|nr:Lrp/AsnC family transcriptional regulator [Streptomyces sp. JHD 1]MCX2970964.1 Lrp/AsnC family transcriptional regulator [Streptomyces sp. JHD 1]